jgi:hypothetical protein
LPGDGVRDRVRPRPRRERRGSGAALFVRRRGRRERGRPTPPVAAHSAALRALHVLDLRDRRGEHRPHQRRTVHGDALLWRLRAARVRVRQRQGPGPALHGRKRIRENASRGGDPARAGGDARRARPVLGLPRADAGDPQLLQPRHGPHRIRAAGAHHRARAPAPRRPRCLEDDGLDERHLVLHPEPPVPRAAADPHHHQLSGPGRQPARSGEGRTRPSGANTWWTGSATGCRSRLLEACTVVRLDGPDRRQVACRPRTSASSCERRRARGRARVPSLPGDGLREGRIGRREYARRCGLPARLGRGRGTRARSPARAWASPPAIVTARSGISRRDPRAQHGPRSRARVFAVASRTRPRAGDGLGLPVLGSRRGTGKTHLVGGDPGRAGREPRRPRAVLHVPRPARRDHALPTTRRP